jgi:hypothetical protein
VALMLRALLKRMRDAAEADSQITLTLYEILMVDAKFFELEQLVLDHRRLIDFLRVDEKAKERAAMVAWLRDCALDPETTGAEMRLFQNLATTIERGEHRRKEDT